MCSTCKKILAEHPYNRETKECPSGHVMKDSKCVVTDQFKKCVCKCSYCPAGEEVKLPEMFEYDFNKYGLTRYVTDKLNEILTYLASKENEKNH